MKSSFHYNTIVKGLNNIENIGVLAGEDITVEHQTYSEKLAVVPPKAYKFG